MSFTEIMRLHF